MPDAIAILDYGSQFTQLIARRVREANVYCEIFPWDAPREKVLAINPSGIILSGSHNSVYDPGAPTLPGYVATAGCLCWAFAMACNCWRIRSVAALPVGSSGIWRCQAGDWRFETLAAFHSPHVTLHFRCG